MHTCALRFHPILRRCLKGFITVTAPLQHIFQFVRSLFLSACSSPLLGFLWCIALSPAQSTQRGISPYHSTHYPQISSPGLRCSFPWRYRFLCENSHSDMLKEPSQEWNFNAMITHLSCCLSINTPRLWRLCLSLSFCLFEHQGLQVCVTPSHCDREWQIFVICQNTRGDRVWRFFTVADESFPVRKMLFLTSTAINQMVNFMLKTKCCSLNTSTFRKE